MKRLWGVLGVVVGFLVLGPFILVVALVALMFGAKKTARKIVPASARFFYDLGHDLGGSINWLVAEIHEFFYARWPGATLLFYLGMTVMLVVFWLIVFWRK